MCGIAGFIDKDRDISLLRIMTDSLYHRGPDDSGYFYENGVALGHRRLSILDLSPNGHQPMEFDNLIIVFNGEIYNFKEIREKLEDLGYSFKSNSDTEVVLKSFHKWREDAVKLFVGMFAFLIYDRADKSFFLVRDRAGVKPVYYFFDGKSFAFASEIRSIIKYIRKPEINRDALYEFLQFGYIGSGITIFKDCYKLEPATYLTLKDNELKKQKYWDIETLFKGNQDTNKSEEELLDELEDIFISSFKYRMVSDVPVGVFLSGGIDSSLLSAILQKHFGNIRTFTIGFKESAYNEAVFAKEIAKYIGTEHTEKILDSAKAKEILDHFVDIYDEPFGDSSGIPTTLVSQVAKESGVKVVLSADGGDELFCGYERYTFTKKIGEILFKVPYPLRLMVSRLMDGVNVDIVAKFIKMKNLKHKYNILSEMLKDKDWRNLYEKIAHTLKNYEVLQLLGKPGKHIDHMMFETGEKIHPLQGMMLWDFNRYLPDDILVKLDRATMYNSIEGRDPFLDHRIVEFAAKLPFNLKYRDNISKYALKKLLERYIPKKLFERPKMGFGIPIFEWFSNEFRFLFDKYLTQERIESQGLLNYKEIACELNQLKNNRPVNIVKLWFILVFEMWYEKWME